MHLVEVHISQMEHWEKFFFQTCGLPLLLFFWLKWAGYLAVAGLNLPPLLPDRVSPFGL